MGITIDRLSAEQTMHKVTGDGAFGAPNPVPARRTLHQSGKPTVPALAWRWLLATWVFSSKFLKSLLGGQLALPTLCGSRLQRGLGDLLPVHVCAQRL